MMMEDVGDGREEKGRGQGRKELEVSGGFRSDLDLFPTLLTHCSVRSIISDQDLFPTFVISNLADSTPTGRD
jgi:hypothetical protein